jgi:hypothetical protein
VAVVAPLSDVGHPQAERDLFEEDPRALDGQFNASIVFWWAARFARAFLWGRQTIAFCIPVFYASDRNADSWQLSRWVGRPFSGGFRTA